MRFMGATWRWAWEYGIGSRKICWVHIIGNSVSVTFTVSGTEEDRMRKTPGWPPTWSARSTRRSARDR